MEKTYHILRVFDYKGGELSTDLNLTYEGMLESLVETLRLYNYIYEFEDTEEDTIDEAKVLREGLLTGELEKWIDDQTSIYGGGDICFSLYECENNIMSEISVSSAMLAEVVAVYIHYIENPE